MKRLLLLVAGVALAAVPAVYGLTANPALSHSVPVRVPAGVVPVLVVDVQVDDAGKGRHGTDGSALPSPRDNGGATEGGTSGKAGTSGGGDGGGGEGGPDHR